MVVTMVILVKVDVDAVIRPVATVAVVLDWDDDDDHEVPGRCNHCTGTDCAWALAFNRRIGVSAVGLPVTCRSLSLCI